jgi:hypothetical protein
MVLVLVGGERIVMSIEATLLKNSELLELTNFVAERENRHVDDVCCGELFCVGLCLVDMLFLRCVGGCFVDD